MAPAQETRSQIVAAAAHVMQTCGLSGATTKEIARAAGCAEGTLYKHFPDKEALFVSVMRERVGARVAPLVRLPERAGTRSVRRNLEEVVRTALDFFRELMPLQSAMYANPSLLAAQRKAMKERGFGPHVVIAAIAEYVRREQRLGRVRRGAHPEVIATLLMGGCYNYLFVRDFTGDDGFVPEDKFVDGTVKTIMAALSVDAPRSKGNSKGKEH
ncbi:MAG TPA: TetR/AcrR family transcriptional regulator [Actinomycetota bacterium]|nr:TetR/AcrR family transcriptional regulator [Actinomycetota bacterium]